MMCRYELAGWTVMTAAALALGGCSAASTFGPVAHYSAGHRGYVVSDLEDGRNPEPSEDVLLLTDPIRGEKIRCREDVERWIASEVFWQEAGDDAAVRALAVAPVTAPFAGAGFYSGMYGESFLAAGRTVYWTQSTRAARGLYEDAMEAFERGDYSRSAILLEHVVVKPPESRGLLAIPLEHRYHLTHYYLGLSYEQLNQREDAAKSLRRFVKSAYVYDRGRYELAEQRLRQLDSSAIDPCDSQEDVVVPWSD